MAIDRKLIDYLPPFVQEYKEIATIMGVEQFEIDQLWAESDNAFADQFIMDATENGVSRRESILDISPKGTDTLDERKFRILTKLNQELPYTMRKLEQALTNLCGEDGYSIVMNPAEYYIEVKLGISNASNYSEVENILKKMIPANMMSTVSIKYNSNSILTQFTHAQLSAYTHERLRNEVFN